MTVTRDEYQSWLDNDVTKRLLREVAEEYEVRKSEIIHGTHEDMIAQAHARNEAMENCEYILNWKPEELEENDD